MEKRSLGWWWAEGEVEVEWWSDQAMEVQTGKFLSAVSARVRKEEGDELSTSSRLQPRIPCLEILLGSCVARLD